MRKLRNYQESRWSLSIACAYVVSATLAGIAGVLMASRQASGFPSAGMGMELETITAAVVGGASLTGGEGNIIGTVFGAFIMTTLRNGGNLLGVNSFVLQVVIGVITIVAVVFDQIRRRRD